MSPFPTELVSKYLSNSNRKVLVEGNYSGQLGAIIRQQTGIVTDYKVLKYNGRRFRRMKYTKELKKRLRMVQRRL